jgi:hypothetical protein
MGASRSKPQPEVPTTSDSQCSYNIFTGNCTADRGYLNSSCTPYALRCYTTNAQAQCSADSECSTSWTGECINRAGAGSLYCRHSGPYGACECYVPTYNARVWPSTTTSNRMYFPERCIPSYAPNDAAVGYAYSGGGTRSYCAMMGYLRFLSKINAQNNAQYVSTVSGGSWFHAVYAFAQRSVSSARLLGAGRIPQTVTLQNLEADNFGDSAYMGQRAADADIVKYVLQALLPGSDVPFDEAYNWTIGKIFLEPYGLNANVPAALNAAHAADIEARNRGLGPALFPADNTPFWLCGATVLYDPLASRGVYVPLIMTLLYSGVPRSINFTPTGGVWIETFALGTNAPGSYVPPTLTNAACATASPSASNNATSISVPSVRNTVPCLRTMIGTSSGALASAVYENNKSTILEKLIPTFRLWSPQFPGQTVTSNVADGSFSDNTGIVALLARGIRKVVSFVNPEEVLADKNTCIGQIAALFGQLPAGCDLTGVFDRNGQQVFKNSEYSGFLQKLLDSKNKGGPTFARASLDVIQNYAYGVEGGYRAEVLMIVLQPSLEFNALLPQEVRNEIAPGKLLANFPNYLTLFQNKLPLKDAGIAQLTKRQVNLLASYTEWCLGHPTVQSQMADMYGVTMQRFTCSNDFKCLPSIVGPYTTAGECTEQCIPGYYCNREGGAGGAPLCQPSRGGPFSAIEDCNKACI